MLLILYRLSIRILNVVMEILGRVRRLQCDVDKIREEQHKQSVALAKILAALEPLPAVGFTFTVELEGVISEGVTESEMTNSQQSTATIQPVDKKGQPAAVDGIPAWASSDETIVTVVPSTDGMSAVVAAVGPLGNAKVSVTADADLGTGVAAIFGTLDVTVTQGQAVGFKITTSDPIEQGTGPVPTPL